VCVGGRGRSGDLTYNVCPFAIRLNGRDSPVKDQRVITDSVVDVTVLWLERRRSSGMGCKRDKDKFPPSHQLVFHTLHPGFWVWNSRRNPELR